MQHNGRVKFAKKKKIIIKRFFKYQVACISSYRLHINYAMTKNKNNHEEKKMTKK